MSVDVPAPIERRIRKQWVRRTRLLGYALVGCTLPVVAVSAYFFFTTGKGFGVGGLAILVMLGVRYFNASLELEGNRDDADARPSTRALVAKLEERMRREDEQHIAGGSGSLSIPDHPDAEGGLALAEAPKTGALSNPQPNERLDEPGDPRRS